MQAKEYVKQKRGPSQLTSLSVSYTPGLQSGCLGCATLLIFFGTVVTFLSQTTGSTLHSFHTNATGLAVSKRRPEEAG